MPPVAMETWMMRDVATSATIIKARAPQRSERGARLKNAHHTTMANAQTSAPIIPTGPASGATMGTTALASNSSTAASTPGHSRSGF